jgi:hypothetical protein
MTPLIAWIGLGLFTAGFVNRYCQYLVRDQPQDVRLIAWVAAILGVVLVWPIPFGILLVISQLPMIWRGNIWTLLPSLRE